MMKNHMRKQKRNTGRGYTLLELVFALALTCILLTIAFVGVIKFLRPLRQLKLDGYAKEIFVAAQNHLTSVWSEDYNGNTKNAYFGTKEVSSGEDEDVYYFIVEGEPSGDSTILPYMLPDDSIDATVLSSGSYIIRYQRSTGLVLDVFYAQPEANRFAHTFNSSDATEYAELMNNYRGDDKKSARRNYDYTGDNSVIGYYGSEGEVDIKPETETLEDPTITIHNEEILYAEITDPNSGVTHDLTITVTGILSGATWTTTLSGCTDESILLSLDDITGQGLGSVGSGALVLNDKTRFCKLASGNAVSFTPGEDITITVSAESATGTVKSAEETTNSLFAEIDSSGVAHINNFRHLENISSEISKQTFVSKFQQDNYYADSQAELDWNDFCSYFNLTADTITIVTDSGTSTGAYLPVVCSANNGAVNYNGQGKTISNVLSRISGRNEGLFEILKSGSAVTDVTLCNFEMEGAETGALAGKAENATLTGILVYNHTVSSSDNGYEITGTSSAGGLLGSAKACTITECAAAVYVNGVNAGGLVGTVTGSSEIKDSYVGGHTSGAVYSHSTSADEPTRINVIASKAAGGLVGDASGAALDVTCSYSTASVLGETAGGLFGVVKEGSATSCYETGLVECTDDGVAGPMAGKYETGAKFSYTGNNYWLTNISEDVKEDTHRYVIGVSGTDTTQTEYILPEEERKNAECYDSTLTVTYKHQFYFPTVEQLEKRSNESYTTTRKFIQEHYGDWQVPSLEVAPFDIINADRLYLRVDLNRLNEESKSITFSISGQSSDNSYIYVAELSEDRKSLTIKDDVTNVTWSTTSSYKTENVTMSYLPAVEYETDATTGHTIAIITLDDITALHQHFSELFNGADNNGLIPGENFGVRMLQSDTTDKIGWSDLSKIDATYNNSLYAYTDANEYNGGTAQISYIRHLQNLDPNVSRVTQNKNNITKANLLNNLTWNETFNYSTIYNCIGSKSTENSFYGICNSDLTLFEGNNFILKQFPIKSTALYDSASKLDSFYNQAENNAGFFRLVPMVDTFTLQNLKVEDFAVTATNGNASAMIAESQAEKTTMDTLLATSDDKKVVSTGTDYAAGGLIGKFDNKTLSINNSAASVYVSADGAAGGLVGWITATGTEAGSVLAGSKVTLTNSYTGGHTQNKKYNTTSGWNVTSSEGSAGGLIGVAEKISSVTMTDVFAATSVSGETAGGIIGTAGTTVKMDTVYSVAPVKNATVDGNSCGALVGKISSGASVENTNTYCLDEVYGSRTRVANMVGSGTLPNEVISAYYNEDEGGIASKKGTLDDEGNNPGRNMQIRTISYDEKLVRDNETLMNRAAGELEYPFAVWTKFNYAESSSGTVSGTACLSYYGDWEPILIKAVETNTVTFKVITPSGTTLTTGVAKDTGDKSLGVQEVTPGQDNKLVVPDIPEVSGYEIDCCYMQGTTNSDGTTTVSGDNLDIDTSGRITLSSSACDSDSTVYIIYRTADDRKVTFYYDKTGANNNFEAIGPSTYVTYGTLYKDITQPSRNIANYHLVGWYTDAELKNAADFSETTTQTVTDEIKFYAKYEKITYNTVTIDFLYEVEGSSAEHLVSTPRYRIDDDNARYSISYIGGTRYSGDITLPTFANTDDYTGISTGSYDTPAAGTITLDADKTTLHITAEGDAHYYVVYKVKKALTNDTYTYRVYFQVGHTLTEGTTKDNWLKNYSATETALFDYYGEIYSAPKGVVPELQTDFDNDPDLKDENLKGTLEYVETLTYNKGDAGFTDIDCDTVYVLSFERQQYTISYNTMGGTYIPPKQMYVGELISDAQPGTGDNPSTIREGHEIDTDAGNSGWYVIDKGEDETGATATMYKWVGDPKIVSHTEYKSVVFYDDGYSDSYYVSTDDDYATTNTQYGMDAERKLVQLSYDEFSGWHLETGEIYTGYRYVLSTEPYNALFLVKTSDTSGTIYGKTSEGYLIRVYSSNGKWYSDSSYTQEYVGDVYKTTKDQTQAVAYSEGAGKPFYTLENDLIKTTYYVEKTVSTLAETYTGSYYFTSQPPSSKNVTVYGILNEQLIKLSYKQIGSGWDKKEVWYYKENGQDKDYDKSAYFVKGTQEGASAYLYIDGNTTYLYVGGTTYKTKSDYGNGTDVEVGNYCTIKKDPNGNKFEKYTVKDTDADKYKIGEEHKVLCKVTGSSKTSKYSFVSDDNVATSKIDETKLTITGKLQQDEGGELYVYDTDGTTKLTLIEDKNYYQYTGNVELTTYETVPVPGDTMPAKNLVAVVQWKVGTAKYTVIYWRQSINDDVAWNQNGENDKKTYDYATMKVMTGNVGETPALPSDYASKAPATNDKSYSGTNDDPWVGFSYLRNDASSKTIKGDGTTVVNVYYDRNIITMNFFTSSSKTEAWSITKADGTKTTYFKGLYGQQITKYGYIWPDYSVLYTDIKGSTQGMTILPEFLFPNKTVTSYDFWKDQARNVHVYFILQKTDGSYAFESIKRANYSSDKAYLNALIAIADEVGGYRTDNDESESTGFTLTDKFAGFSLYQWKNDMSSDAWGTQTFNASGNKYDAKASGNNTTVSSTYPNCPADNAESGKRLFVAFQRKVYTLDCMNVTTGEQEGTSQSIMYGASLEGKEITVSNPTDANLVAQGYTWDGKYYADPKCTQEFDFASSTMPANNLIVYVQYVLPSYKVVFDAQGGTMSATDTTVLVENTKSLEHARTAEGENVTIVTVDGNWETAYQPTRADYDFEGWYYLDAQGQEMLLTGSTGFTSEYMQVTGLDMSKAANNEPVGTITVYAKWKPQKQEETEEYRDVKVTYVYEDTNGICQYFKADGTLTSDKTDALVDTQKSLLVGSTQMFTARDFDGYYAQNTVWYHKVTSDKDQEVTFTYTKIEPWTYTVVTKLLYGSQNMPEELKDRSFDTEALEYTLSVSTGNLAYNQYETISFTLPEGYEAYHLSKTVFNGVESYDTVLTISPDAERTATVTYYLELDPSKLSVGDYYYLYDGTTPPKSVTDTETTFKAPDGVTITRECVYRYFDKKGNALEDADVVNAGAYKMNGYVILHVKDEKQNVEKQYLVWMDESHTLNLHITRRTLTITSASGTFTFDGYVHTCPSFTITGDGFASGEGLENNSLHFSVEAFRLNPGVSDNAFTFELNENTSQDNYVITSVFGTIVVNEK